MTGDLRPRWRVLLGLLLTCLVTVPLASGADPLLETLVPRGGQVGTEVDVVVIGQRLAAAKELLWFRTGIEVVSIENENDRRVRVRLRIAADCPLGEHPVALRTAAGLTEIETFHVGALPEINEQEPNGDTETAQPIPLDVTVNGVVTAEDVDRYTLEIAEPMALTVDVAGLRLGDTPFDPHLTVLGPQGETLLIVDDTPFGRLDPVGRVVIEKPGSIQLVVRESAYGGSDRCHYRLHVGQFPLARAAVPASVRLGEESAVQFVGEGSVWDQVVTGVEPGRGTVDWFVRDGRGVATSPIRLVVSQMPTVVEAEPATWQVRASAWRLAGPFPNPPGEGEVGQGHAAVHPPETELALEATYPGRDGEVRWVEHPEFADGKIHDLTKEIQPSDHALVYLWRRLESPIEQSVPIALGTDDTVKVWLNGTLLHEHAAARGVQADADHVILPLKKGSNDLLLKVTNGSGGFGFTLRGTRTGFARRSQPVPLPCAAHGVIAQPGETDTFRFSAEKDRELEFVVRARELRSPLDAILQVRSLDGRGLVANDDSGGPDPRLRFKPPESGEYVLAIWDHLRDGGPEHFYRVEIDRRRGERGLRVSVPGRPDDLAVAVPRGGRMATVLRLDGLDLRRGIRPVFFGLPDGLTVTTGALQGGTVLVPVVFSATAESTLAAAGLSVRAQEAAGDAPLPVDFLQRVPLVKVENNQTFLETEVDRLPVAVVEASPFMVDVVTPTVPIIQASPLPLTVRVTRREGFAAPVRVRLLWNPPGLSSGEVTFNAEETEKVLSINANGNAREGTWSIAAIGRADAGGEWAVSSELVPLEVSKPWIRAQIGKTRVEQSQATELEVSFETLRDGIESYDARIVNLPREVTTEFPSVAAGSHKIAYSLAVGEKAPPGRHQNLLLLCSVPSPGGAVVHYVRGGELRIDKPLPPERRKSPAPAAPSTEEKPSTDAATPKKPVVGTLTKPKT